MNESFRIDLFEYFAICLKQAEQDQESSRPIRRRRDGRSDGAESPQSKFRQEFGAQRAEFEVCSHFTAGNSQPFAPLSASSLITRSSGKFQYWICRPCKWSRVPCWGPIVYAVQLIPTMWFASRQGTVVNPVAAALCALIVYAEFLIHPMVLMATSRRMRQEIFKSLKRHISSCYWRHNYLLLRTHVRPMAASHHRKRPTKSAETNNSLQSHIISIANRRLSSRLLGFQPFTWTILDCLHFTE